jgi:hypothetical protein
MDNSREVTQETQENVAADITTTSLLHSNCDRSKDDSHNDFQELVVVSHFELNRSI